MADPAREQLDQSEQRDQAPGHVPGPDPAGAQPAAPAEAKAQEPPDAWRRPAAEFENYKKRTAREQASLSTRATEHLVKELLPIAGAPAGAPEAAAGHAGGARAGGPGGGRGARGGASRGGGGGWCPASSRPRSSGRASPRSRPTASSTHTCT